MSWVVLVTAIPLLVAGCVVVWRRPLLAVYAFIVGLAFHTAIIFLLWVGGVHGWQLRTLQAWKEILLATALLSVAARSVRARRLPFEWRPLDLAVVAFVLVALAYFVVPQHLLGGSSGLRARTYALRELLVPAGAYFLGRALVLPNGGFTRIAKLVLVTSFAVAAIGIVEDYAVPLGVWRSAHAARFFTQQLNFPPLHGPAGLPDSFAVNTSSGVFRRLVSTYLSPLATAYMLAVALVIAVIAWPQTRRRGLLAGASVVILAALLLALSRATALALVAALVLLAIVRRRRYALAAAAAVLASSLVVAAAFGSVAPRTHFFPEDRAFQVANARAHGGLAQGSPLTTTATLSDPSSTEHLSELERGFRNFLRHPAGFGLGNGGENALRFGGEVAAGESQYLIVAVQTGVLGLVALVALVLVTLAELLLIAWRAGPPEVRLAGVVLLAAQALVFAIGIQTEVWAVPWLVYVLWWGTGAVLTASASARGGLATPTSLQAPEGRRRTAVRSPV